MFLPHKVFLKWLMYATVVLTVALVFMLFGIPQLVFHHDHLYLTSALLAMYLAAEVLAGREAIGLSRETRITEECLSWLKRNPKVFWLADSGSEATVSVRSGEFFHIPRSYLYGHLGTLIRKADLSSGHRIDQSLLLDTLADRIEFRSQISSFIGSLIVWVGILGTILGVVLAFWPYVSLTTFDVETLRLHMGEFFRGVAVAFLPTAVSFVFKIALDINHRIVAGGTQDLIDNITVISEAYALPALEARHAKG